VKASNPAAKKAKDSISMMIEAEDDVEQTEDLNGVEFAIRQPV
jgi:hypothetical protein